MPVVSLPDYLTEELENSESGMIDNTQGPGVAAIVSSDGLARADIYIGLELDGFTYYENISSADPSIKMQFALTPVVSCRQSDVITISDNSDSVTIQVKSK